MPIQKVYTVQGARKIIRDMPKHLQKEVRQAGGRIATRIAQGAKSRAQSQGRLPARVGRTIRARPDRFGAIVQMGSETRLSGGGTINDLWGGAEFGAKRRVRTERGGSTMQFRPWRGNQWVGTPGYFLYPEIREQEDDAVREWLDAIQDALGKG